MGAPQTAQSAQQIVNELGRKARVAASLLVQTSDTTINKVLDSIAAKLRDNTKAILEANEIDIAAGRQKGLSPAMIDRLKLNEQRVEGMAKGLEVIKSLPDPVGKILWETTRPNGMKIQRVSVPIGVLGMIYESRPNVTIDASAL